MSAAVTSRPSSDAHRPEVPTVTTRDPRWVRWALVVGSPRTGADQLLALDLADGSERTLVVAELLADPARFFGGVGHA